MSSTKKKSFGFKDLNHRYKYGVPEMTKSDARAYLNMMGYDTRTESAVTEAALQEGWAWLKGSNVAIPLSDIGFEERLRLESPDVKAELYERKLKEQEELEREEEVKKSQYVKVKGDLSNRQFAKLLKSNNLNASTHEDLVKGADELGYSKDPFTDLWFYTG